jgi:hypothetical protein
MADAVTSQVLLNGPRHLVMKFTNESDGTGESAVVKVDATSTTYANTIQGNVIVPGTHLKVTRVVYDVRNMGLRIRWDADTDTDMLVLGNGSSDMNFTDIGGLQNPLGTGATGSILFTTVGAASGSSYSVVLYMTKGVPQS